VQLWPGSSAQENDGRKQTTRQSYSSDFHSRVGDVPMELEMEETVHVIVVIQRKGSMELPLDYILHMKTV
jgi:hypothetical protein